jgi:hypothetical protein
VIEVSKRSSWNEAQLGMDLVTANEREIWKARALSLLWVFLQECPSWRTFSADDLRDWWANSGLWEPHHVNTYGAMVRIATSKGWMLATGEYTRSERDKAHSRVLPLYRSLVSVEGVASRAAV